MKRLFQWFKRDIDKYDLIAFLVFFVLTLCLLLACNEGTPVKPVDVDYQHVIESDISFVTPGGIPVAVHPDLNLSTHGVQEAKKRIDECVVNYAYCMDRDPSLLLIQMQQGKFYLVDGSFKCPHHNGVCNGRWMRRNGRDYIVLAREAIAREGDYPLCEHEVSHATGDYNTEHSNATDKLLSCIKYE